MSAKQGNQANYSCDVQSNRTLLCSRPSLPIANQGSHYERTVALAQAQVASLYGRLSLELPGWIPSLNVYDACKGGKGWDAGVAYLFRRGAGLLAAVARVCKGEMTGDMTKYEDLPGWT
jgi:hypothetical protein